MADEATTTPEPDPAVQGQQIADELIDSFGEPIDDFGEIAEPATPDASEATPPPAPEVTPAAEPVQPLPAGDVVPPAVTPAAPGSGEGVPPAPAATQTPVQFPSQLLELSGLSEQQAREAFGTPDKLFQAMSDFDARMVATGRQLLSGGIGSRGQLSGFRVQEGPG